MIGARLKQARAAAGLSLRDLEARMERLVSAQAIGKYERDEMMPSSKVLLALAGELHVSPAYLLKVTELSLGEVEFRKKTLTNAKQEASVRAQVLDAVQRYREVEGMLAIDGAWVPPSSFPRAAVTLEDGERAAAGLRDRWELGLDPIADLCVLLEDHQIKVHALDLLDDVSGVHAEIDVGQNRTIPVVVVNSREAGERQRFTLAHELAHVVLKTAHDRAGEKICQRFASAFLMTKQTMVRETGPRRHALSVLELFRLKALFGVSAQAIAYRCRDVGIISDALFRSIFQIFGKKGWRKQEPNPLSPEKPLRYERLVIRALAENVIGEVRAAELLGVSTWQLIEMLNNPPEGSPSASQGRRGPQ